LGSRSSVTLYKGHLGVGVAEPSGQLELAGDARIQEYPPGPMSGYETLIPGHGVFCVSASTFASSSYETYFAFDNNNSTAWLSQPSYDNTTGGYTTSISTVTTGNIDGSGTSSGEWLQISLPSKIFLKRSGWIPQGDTRGPKTGVILGSNDGSEWNTIHSFSGKTYSGTIETELFSGTSSTAYQYFRIIGNTVGAGARLEGREWKLFGTPGPTTLDKGSLSLTRSLDVPRISRYDVDTETPRPEKLVVDFDTTVNSSPTDISGNGNHGTFGGSAYYSSADKAFILANNPAAVGSASTHYIRAELNNSETGNQYHSVSLWFKVLSGQNSSWRAIFECGENPRSGNSDISLYVPGGDDKLVFAHGGSSMYSDTLTNLYFQWHHVVLTYDGANRKMYLDGTLIKTQATTTWAGVGNMTLHFGRNNTLGGTEGCDCHVSNFKLYWQTALEPSEVQKLYRLGRTGRSMVISDTAVGIGKVPEAQLDVRGYIKCDGVITSNIPAFRVRKILPGTPSAWLVANNGVIDFTTVDVNNGDCYDGTNKFTASVSGIYFINVSKALNTYGKDQTIRHPSLSIVKNDVVYHTINNGVSTASDVDDASYTHYGTSASCVISLVAGDYVQATFSYDNGYGTQYEYGIDTFSGFLIAQL